MKKLAALVACILVSSSAAAPAHALDYTDVAPEGTVADAVANISFTQGSGDGDCTGTAIAEHWVLTARHCIEGLSETTGTVTLGQGDNRTTYPFDFFEPTPTQDFALLHTTEPMKPTTFPELGTMLKEKDTATFYGWSAKGMGKTGKLPMANAEVEAVADHPLYGDGKAMHMRFAGSALSQPGDSGGPLIKDNHLIGVASVALGSSESSASIAVVGVEPQREWITERIATPEDQVQPPTAEELAERGFESAAASTQPDLPRGVVWVAVILTLIVGAAFMYRARRTH